MPAPQTSTTAVDPNQATVAKLIANGDDTSSSNVVVLNSTDVLSSTAQLPFGMSFDK